MMYVPTFLTDEEARIPGVMMSLRPKTTQSLIETLRQSERVVDRRHTAAQLKANRAKELRK